MKQEVAVSSHFACMDMNYILRDPVPPIFTIPHAK